MDKFSINIQDLKIKGNIHLPSQVPAPCVICSHGLFSAKDSPKYKLLAEELSEAGFVVIRYDHRGCGQSDGNIEETTVSSRIKDLLAIYSFAQEHFSVNGSIGLMGSSMGGYISLFAAAQYPLIKALVVWSTPLKLSKKKEHYTQNNYPSLKEDFFIDLQKYNLLEVLNKIDHCLILHGEKDEVVPAWQSREVFENILEPKDLVIFSGAEHRFTNKDIRQKAVNLSKKWFTKYLKFDL